MATVTTRSVTPDGAVATRSSTYLVTERVRGGIYIGGNGDWRPDFTSVNIRSFTGYHSLAESGPAIYPGQQWRVDLVNAGALYNLVVELKWYGAGSTVGGQDFTVEGRPYWVPAPNGRIQRRTGSSSDPVAWSYDQITSGQCDGLLHRLLVELRKVPAGSRVNVQFASEVDTDNEFGTSAGSTAYGKVESNRRAEMAYAYIISYMKIPPLGIAKLGTNISFSVGWAGSSDAWSGFDAFQQLHPETMPIDFMQWNVYNHVTATPAPGHEVHPYDRLMEMIGQYRRLGPVMRSKNIIIAEWGVSKFYPGGQAAYIDEWAAAVQRVNAEQVVRGEGQIVVTNYFASRDATWGLLDPKVDGIAALKRAYMARPFALNLSDV